MPNNTDFVAVQLPEYTDVFDYEKSVYKKSTYAVPEYDENGQEKWFVSDIKEYVFRISERGLPPIFRIKEDHGNRLFISHEARLALKEAKITGVRYISLQGYRYGEISSEIDVPFTLPSEQERIKKAKTAHVLGVLR